MFEWNIGQAILYPIIIVGLLFYFHIKVFEDNYFMVEFTKREKIISVGIGFIFLTIIIILFNSLSAKQNDYSRILQSATYIDNKDTFDYAYNTSIGNSIIKATFSTTKPINDRIAKDCLYLERDYEEYRQHTYTTTDSKGNTTVHTYWSWDLIRTDRFKPKTLIVYNHNFDISNLDLNMKNLDNMGTDNFAIHKRYIYKGIYNNSSGILLTFIENNNFRNDNTLIDEKSILYNKLGSKEEIINQIKSETNESKLVVILFFGILGIGIIAFFGYSENNWLNE